jgi:hypothetical protein
MSTLFMKCTFVDLISCSNKGRKGGNYIAGSCLVSLTPSEVIIISLQRRKERREGNKESDSRR